MRAMILAAGLGKRMQPLTLTTPKALLKVWGTPMIERQILALKKAAIKEIVINLGHLGTQIEEYLGDGKRLGVTIEYTHEDPILETGGGIKNALHLLGDKFIAVSCDIVTEYDFSRLITLSQQSPLFMVFVPNPVFHAAGDFALIDGKVALHGDEKFNYAGISAYTSSLFADFTSGYFPLNDVYLAAIKSNLAMGELFTGSWHNIGTVQQLEDLNNNYVELG